MRLAVAALAVALFAAPLAAAAPASEDSAAPASTSATGGASETDPHKQKLLQDIQKTATPDAHHQALLALTGKFDTQAKMWLGSKFPERTTGHDHAEPILGGRFVDTLTTRDWDDPSGKTRPTKFVITIDNEQHHWKRIYEKVAGKETLTLEIEYRRVK
jgi:hypothetical protein